ncbi:MAG: hypothetical protein EHM41_01720 [Chloroflexi bacterium]|nr:MAG: hypothetical protein EHM41_01720 [Chloroflexota bacterium]
MKIIAEEPTPAPDNALSKASGTVQDFLTSTFGRPSDAQAQEPIIAYMGKTLNNRFTLLRDYKLEGVDVPIPMILIGPTGIYLIYASAAKGVFQIKGEAMSEMKGSKNFSPVRPNLVHRVMMMTNAFDTHLKNQGLEVTDIQPVLFFASPGTHVESIRPSVRIVQIDGLERFTSTVLQGRVVFSSEDVHNILNLMTHAAAPSVPVEPVEDPDSMKKKVGTIEPRLSQGLHGISRRMNLSSRQWILLGVMALFNVLILIGFIFLLVLTS